MLALTWLSERTGSLSLTSMLGQIWALPFLVALYVIDNTKASRWLIWALTSLLLTYPTAHAIQVGWNSRNSNTVRSRTVSAAAYNMFAQASSVTAANVYREDDSPRYRNGNRALIGVACFNIVLYVLIHFYYKWVNARRDKVWNSWTQEQREEYLKTTKAEGNKRLDFRFAY